MRKNKILTFVLAVAMTLALALPVTATAATTGSITVDSSNTSLGIDHTDFSAYKLFDVVTSPNASTGGLNYAYTPVPAVATFLSTRSATYGTDLQVYLNGSPDMTQLTKDLQDSGLFTAIPATQVSGSTTKVEFTGLAFGYYLVVGQGTATDGSGQTVVAHSALVTIDEAAPDATIDLKGDAPTIDKTVYNHNSDTWIDWTDLNVGDKADFKLTSAVPDMTGYKTYQYIVNDTMDAGLSMASDFEAHGVTVTIGGVAFTDFTTKVTDQSFTVTFGSSFINQTKGAQIVITYSATLNQNAVYAPASNDNEAWLQYSDSPYTTGLGESAHHIVHVYTFKFGIKKIDELSGNPLANATFNLHTTTDTASPAIKFKQLDAGSASTPAVYIVDETGSADITTPASGMVTIEGVDAATYYLFETAAPAGYNKLDHPVTVVIKHKVTDGVSDFTPVNIDVENSTGTILPITGGIGTTIFYAVAAILTLGLIAFFVIRKRRNALAVK